jgi:hypothetical protein
MSYLKEMNRPAMTTATTTNTSKMTQATLNAMEEDDAHNSYKFVLIDKQNSRLTRIKSKHSSGQAKSLLASNLSVISKEAANTTANSMSTTTVSNLTTKVANGNYLKNIS